MNVLTQIPEIFSDFSNPAKRVFVGYLVLSLVIGLLWLIVIRRQSLRMAAARVFDRKVFFSKSAQADYKIFVLNRVFSLFISPLMITQMAIATAIYFALHRQSLLQSGQWDDAPLWLIVALYTVTMFVVDDFTKYLVHRWMHHWPILWTIHKVHHAAKTMTPITVYRVHPLEGILYGLRATCSLGVTISLFFFLFGDQISLYTVLGANVLAFVFHVTGSNLRHSHIDIKYWPWLEHIVISPAQHQLHHSVAERHYDKNFGVALAIWDWIFGSLHLSETDNAPLEYGLTGKDRDYEDRLSVIYLRPFAEMAQITRRRLRKIRQWMARTLTARP